MSLLVLQFYNNNMFTFDFGRLTISYYFWSVSWRFHSFTSMAVTFPKYLMWLLSFVFWVTNHRLRYVYRLLFFTPCNLVSHFSFTLWRHVSTSRYFNNYYVSITYIVVYLLIFLYSRTTCNQAVVLYTTEWNLKQRICAAFPYMQLRLS